MSYIGKTPVVGNFQVCDAISVVNGQAAYTMQVGSANVLPESVNNMLVSLNGVIQKPNSAYTVSNSTITFASNLASGDVIDFIQIFGDVLNIGTPSDGAVTSTKLASNSVTTAKITDANVTGAKTNFVSTSSAAGLQIKGDGTTDGYLQLNCSQNSHGIKLKSPPHSASASYTLTFPNNDGDASQFLQTNGSGVMTWADAGGGITGFDSWRLTSSYTGSSGTIDGSWERQDLFSENIKLGTGMSESSGVFTFPSTGIWQIGFWTELTHSAASNYNGFYLDVSANGGTNYTHAQGAWSGKDANNRISTIGANIFINVSNATNYRIKATASGTNNAAYDGNTTTNYTYFTFIRLGDST